MQLFELRMRGYRGLVKVKIKPDRYEGFGYRRVPPPLRPLGQGYV